MWCRLGQAARVSSPPVFGSFKWRMPAVYSPLYGLEECSANTKAVWAAKRLKKQDTHTYIHTHKKKGQNVYIICEEGRGSALPFSRLIGWRWQWLTCIHGNRAANLPSPIGNHRRGAWLSFSDPPPLSSSSSSSSLQKYISARALIPP